MATLPYRAIVKYMNKEQLIRKIRLNREQLTRNDAAAAEELYSMKAAHPELLDEEVRLSLALSEALFESHAKSDYKRSIDISLAALAEFPDSPYRNMVSMITRNIGLCYAHLGEFDLAERYLLDALNNLDQSDSVYKSNKALILHNLAMTCEFKGTGLEKAIDYLNQALVLLENDSDHTKKANCLMGLGNLYNSLDNLPKALDKYLQAAEIFETDTDLGNIAATYSNIANCYLKMQEFELSESYHNKALELRIKLGTPYPLGVSYYNLGVHYKRKGDYVNASLYLHKAHAIISELGDKPFIAQISQEIDAVDLISNR